MTLDEIINELSTSAGVPREALRAGVADFASLRPHVLALARKLVDGVWLLPDDAQLLLRGLHVLAAAKDTTAWPVLRELLKLPDEDIERYIGHGAGEVCCRLTLSLWDGDDSGLLDLVTDPTVGWQARWGLFEVVARLCHDGRLDRTKATDLFDRCERERVPPEDSLAWVGWERAVAHLGLAELKPALERVWATKRVFSDHRGIDRAETLRLLEAAVASPNDAHEFDRDRITPIDDPVEAMEWLERQNSFGLDGGVVLHSGDQDAAGLGAQELDWLAGFLECAQVPETAMNIEMLDGFLTALIAGPSVVQPSDCFDTIWGDDGAAPAFDTKEQAQYFFNLVMRRWNAIAAGLMHGDPVAPIIIGYDDDQVGRDWADGFLLGLDFHETLTATGKEQKRTDRLIAPILALAGPEVYGSRITAARCEEILEELPQTILRCAAAWRPNAVPAPVAGPVRATKVGRNDPCPCGSGKKYKKCCGSGGSTGTMH